MLAAPLFRSLVEELLLPFLHPERAACGLAHVLGKTPER